MTNNDFKDTINELILQGDYKKVDPTMTTNEKNINVEKETEVEATIQEALNSSQEDSVISASLDGFKLVNNGSKYLQVKHASLAEATIGIVGKAEFAASKDKVALLKGIVRDSMPNIKIAFEGEWREPNIDTEVPMSGEEEMEWYCPECKNTFESYDVGQHRGCPGKLEVMTDETVVPAMSEEEHYQNWLKEQEQPKDSWLTSDLESAQKCPQCNEDVWDVAGGGMTGAKLNKCWNCGTAFDSPEAEDMEVSLKTIAIKTDESGKAHQADHLAQSLQLEDQKIASQNDKIKTEAVNALVSMLQGMGHGSSKIAEVTESSTGYDIMSTIDSNGALRAVSIPVTVKEGKVVLPKKALVSELIQKGLNIQAALTESFSQEVLNKIAETEARIAYETKEAEDIIAERPVVKQASGSNNEMFLSETDTMEVQKHLLPDHEKMKKGDKISDGADQWELVDTDSNQNDKNEGSASIWKFKKCAPPAADKKEPETKIKA